MRFGAIPRVGTGARGNEMTNIYGGCKSQTCVSAIGIYVPTHSLRQQLRQLKVGKRPVI